MLESRVTIFILESFDEGEYPAGNAKTIEEFQCDWDEELASSDLARHLWDKDANTACHILAELGFLQYQFTTAWCRTKSGTEKLEQLKRVMHKED